MYDLLITGGTVVTAEASFAADVAVQRQNIAALLAPGGDVEAARRVDASGLLVIPGGIDPHNHLRDQHTGRPVPGIERMTAAAAVGGTTTFLDFTASGEGSSLEANLAARRRDFEGRSAIDFGLHVILNRPGMDNLSPEPIAEMAACVAQGTPSFKIYLGHNQNGPPAGDGLLYAAMVEAARLGAVLGIHAENAPFIDREVQRLLLEGKTSVAYFSAAKPAITEEECVERCIRFGAEAGAALYFVHLSSRGGAHAVGEARRRGLPVYGETCPHYLAFTDEVYQRPLEQAIQFLRLPPIRGPEHREGLWEGVTQGWLSTLGTDHVTPVSLREKVEISQGQPFTRLPGGMAQIETRVAWLYSEGVATGRISRERWVAMVSTNPARIFGLYPGKGSLEVGADADIVLFDPIRQWIVRAAELAMGVDYTVYEGQTFTGKAVSAFQRGRLVVDQGRFVGDPAGGQFLERRIAREVTAGPA